MRRGFYLKRLISTTLSSKWILEWKCDFVPRYEPRFSGQTHAFVPGMTIGPLQVLPLLKKKSRFFFLLKRVMFTKKFRLCNHLWSDLFVVSSRIQNPHYRTHPSNPIFFTSISLSLRQFLNQPNCCIIVACMTRRFLAPVVQRPDNFIQWISHYPTVSICAKISVFPRAQANMHTLTTA